MKRLFFTAFACCLAASALADDPRQDMTADRLLAGVRYATANQKDLSINGRVRKNSTKVPFGIHLKDGNIYFSYSQDGSKWDTFELRFKQKAQELYTYENGKPKKFTSKRYGETIPGTDITFEDLSLRFLYWPNGQILPQDHTSFIKGRKCYVVNLPNPAPGNGAYAWIRAWIDEESGALMQIDAFDEKGRHLKRFTITSVMKTQDTWFFKQMRIERRNPDNPKKVLGVDYIELDD